MASNNRLALLNDVQNATQDLWDIESKKGAVKIGGTVAFTDAADKSIYLVQNATIISVDSNGQKTKERSYASASNNPITFDIVKQSGEIISAGTTSLDFTKHDNDPTGSGTGTVNGNNAVLYLVLVKHTDDAGATPDFVALMGKKEYVSFVDAERIWRNEIFTIPDAYKATHRILCMCIAAANQSNLGAESQRQAVIFQGGTNNELD